MKYLMVSEGTQSCEDFMGYKCCFTNSSYNCPQLKLFGFASERQLQNAIKKKLKDKKPAEIKEASDGDKKRADILTTLLEDRESLAEVLDRFDGVIAKVKDDQGRLPDGEFGTMATVSQVMKTTARQIYGLTSQIARFFK